MTTTTNETYAIQYTARALVAEKSTAVADLAAYYQDRNHKPVGLAALVVFVRESGVVGSESRAIIAEAARLALSACPRMARARRVHLEALAA